MNDDALFGPGPVTLELNVNGQELSPVGEPCLTLVQVLRERFGLTGAKQVCDRASCGACTVLLDGKRIYSCSILAISAQGHQITTVESLASDGEIDPLQQAFVAADASQCGYCTSGFIMSAKAFLAANPTPSLDDIHRGMSGNVCRCGTYAGIESAVLAVAQQSAKRTTRG
jgi:xanthine dehydrogenase YagT iron-sulfur-binding subunit